MRALLSVSASIAILLVLSLFAAASAQCPSKAYFRANAQNPIENFDATLNSTVCVSINTAPTRVRMRSLIVAEVLNTAKLEQALLSRLAGADQCGFFNLGGWDLTEASVSLLGSASSARIRVVATAKSCQIAVGTRLTYQVPLIITYADNILSLRLDDSNAKLTWGKKDHNVPFGVGATIASKLNNVIAGKTFDTTPYIPSYVRDLNPTVSDPSIVLQSHRLTVKIALSGTLTKPVADQLLTDSVKTYVVPSIIRWFGSGIPIS